MAREIRGAVAHLFGCTDREVLIEGRAGTGKSIGILSYLHDRARRYPGCRILICRKTRESCTDSVMVSFEEKVLGPTHPMLAGAGRQNRHSYTYPNRSEIVVGGLDKPAKLFSTEWDIVYVNEGTEISAGSWELFGRAMRNGKMPYQQRIADCNPEAPGHWLNCRAAPCTDTIRNVENPADYRRLQEYNTGPQSGPMRRMVSVHQDNPHYFDLVGWKWLAPGQTYIAELDAMTGHRRERMRRGRWVAAEGIVFPEFDDDHIVPGFAVPHDWPVYVGIDPGFDCPCAILWLTVAPNQTVFVMDELYRGGLSIAQHAQDIHARNHGRNIRRIYADPQHAFSRTAQSPKTIAGQFADCGINVGPWPRSTDKQAMVEAVRDKLRARKLFFFKNCVNTINEMQSWSYKRRASNPDSPLPGDDTYEQQNDHTIDCVCGLIAAKIDNAPGKLRVIVGE